MDQEKSFKNNDLVGGTFGGSVVGAGSYKE